MAIDATRAFSNKTEKESGKLVVWMLAITMFVTGACGFIYEYLMATVSTYILGNATQQYVLITGLMLFFMAIAGWVQKFMSQEKLVEKFILTEIALAVIGGFSPITVYWAFGSIPEHFSLVLYFAICSIGFLIGLEIPLAMRINDRYVKNLETNIASIWSLDYFGSLVGSVLFALVLIKVLPLTEIGFLIASANLVIAIGSYLVFWKRRDLVYSWIWIPLAICGLALCFGYSKNLAWSSNLEQKLYEDRIVYAQTTKYQRLVMTYNKSLGEYRLYINGNLQFSSLDEQIYHEQLVHPVMALVPDHRRVLVLGGGDGLALREILKYKDVQSVTLVDLDPEMIRISKENPVLRELNKGSFLDARVRAELPTIQDVGVRRVYQETGEMLPGEDGHHPLPEVKEIAKVNIFTLDADKFVGKTAEKWNVIIVDLPDPTSIELAKLYSQQFYQKIKRLLAENGMMVIQSTSPYHAKSSYLCIRRTVEAAGFETLPYHDNVPSFGDWGYILCWKKEASRDIGKQVDSMEEFSVATRYLEPEVFKKAMVFGKGWLVDKNRDVSTLMHPTILDHYIGEDWKVE